MGKIEEFKLRNGIRVVLVPLIGRKSVVTQIFLKVGSKFESRNEFGMSHVVEHMTFKGTVKRPDQKIISAEADSKGAHFNAFTDYELTSYHLTTIWENLPWAIEMLSDLLFNSIFDSGEFEKEKGVIVEEIKMYHDDPRKEVSSDFMEFLYGRSEYGCWSTTGEVKDIMKMNRESVWNFRKKYLNPKELVVVVAGDVLDTKKIKDLVKDYFGWFANNDSQNLPDIKMILNKEKILKKKKMVEQAHFCLGIPAFSSDDKRRYALKLLDLTLSGNMSSRLWQRIREERGLAYYVYSITESLKEGGVWGVQAGVKMDSLDLAADLIKEEIQKIKHDLDENEIKRTKDYLLGITKLEMDDVGFWSYFIGRRVLLDNKLVLPDDELERYKKVNLKEINLLTKEFFLQKEMRIVSITK